MCGNGLKECHIFQHYLAGTGLITRFSDSNEFRSETKWVDILTKDETLADGVVVLDNITGASTSKFSLGHLFEKGEGLVCFF